MKVGILTFQNAHNYGAVLQCYALKKWLEREGHNVEVINYQNPAISKTYRKRLANRYPLSDVLHFRRIPRFINGYLDSKYAQKDWSLQYEKFDEFIDEILLEKKRNEARNPSAFEYDAIIAGSDQLWNAHLTGGLDRLYFLDFQTKARKIFYGVSNGTSAIPDDQLDYYRTSLKNVYGISTREQKLADDIMSKLNYHAVSVVDPTLLLASQDYQNLINPIKPKEKFIFSYFVHEDKTLIQASEYLSRVLEIPVIELHYYKTRNLKSLRQRADMGPKEFLWHMRNADYILTNSLHGTIFSLLFHKKFYSLYGTDARKDNLLQAVACQSRHIQGLSEIDLKEEINYENVDNCLDSLKHISVEFLREMLKEGD